MKHYEKRSCGCTKVYSYKETRYCSKHYDEKIKEAYKELEGLRKSLKELQEKVNKEDSEDD